MQLSKKSIAYRAFTILSNHRLQTHKSVFLFASNDKFCYGINSRWSNLSVVNFSPPIAIAFCRLMADESHDVIARAFCHVQITSHFELPWYVGGRSGSSCIQTGMWGGEFLACRLDVFRRNDERIEAVGNSQPASSINRFIQLLVV